MIVLRIFIFIYGLLSILAVVEEAKALGFQLAHIFYILFGGLLMVAAFMPGHSSLIYIGLIGLLLFIIIYASLTDTLNWRHILVRTVVTVVVIFLWRHFV